MVHIYHNVGLHEDPVDEANEDDGVNRGECISTSLNLYGGSKEPSPPPAAGKGSHTDT